MNYVVDEMDRWFHEENVNYVINTERSISRALAKFKTIPKSFEQKLPESEKP